MPRPRWRKCPVRLALRAGQSQLNRLRPSIRPGGLRTQPFSAAAGLGHQSHELKRLSRNPIKGPFDERRIACRVVVPLMASGARGWIAAETPFKRGASMEPLMGHPSVVVHHHPSVNTAIDDDTGLHSTINCTMAAGAVLRA